jgi:hypothetical protein
MSNNGRSNNGSKTTKNEGVDRAHRPEYQPTAREQQALRKQIQRLEAEPAAPRFKVTKSGTARVLSVDHPDEGSWRKRWDLSVKILSEAQLPKS